ncbi:phosphatidate phosphatase LPIN3 [Eurytemora carolleeae]|uniref:phosphatidate phosphatase LPIN3 n=1 Tax=Eurytemora carolleeae TaxID=1294199 RepID=UPI000C7580BA|nr:phosphatidate phosphatase LPIN3 [Eurytemora carolleeae]|eukprot:XP_023337794.1 phosphatidate phosphatase LPIN3-like [Eurytemora affinis]
MLIYLSSRGIGQSESTREYLHSLREEEYTMPSGPILLYTDSVINALTAEIIDGNPEVQKISKLARVRGVFSGNPLFAAYGNRDSDIMAYKALSIPEDHIFRLDEESLLVSQTDITPKTFREHIDDLENIYPKYIPL